MKETPVEPRIDAILEALDDVKDPEIPVVSVVELGIVQSVHVDHGTVRIAITPTFSGCPALELMRQEIAERVKELGYEDVDVTVVLDPPWSSDRIAPAARERMKSIGLAPPPPAPTRHFQADITLVALGTYAPTFGTSDDGGAIACPFCGSVNTHVENPFGPTICRALHYCNACQQPFESFKAL